MARIGLHSGAWSNFGSFTLTGAGAVIGATTEQGALQILGWAGMAFGLAVLIWGVTIDGEQWWKRIPRLRFPRLWRGQMYVGQILAFDSQLDALHTLSLTVRGYNGTGRDRIFLGASGNVNLGYTLNGTGPEGIRMAPPGLVDPPTIIPANSEFNINFQQPLTPEQVSFFREWEAQGADIQMMFEGMAIMTKPARFGRAERLALWDGISLRNGRFFGRIVCVTCNATASSSATLGGRK